MKFKRIRGFLVGFFASFFCLPGAAFAADVTILECDLPLLRADISATAQILNQPVSVSLDGDPINIQLARFHGATDYVFYIDVSTSINIEGFLAAKSFINTAASTLQEGETVSVYAFGNELTQLLDHCADSSQIREVVEGIQMNNQYTCFYETLVHAFSTQNAETARCYIISDGENSVPRGDTEYSFASAKAAAAESSVFVQALCYDSASAKKYAEFYEITEPSGGFYRLSAAELIEHSNAIIAERPLQCEVEFAVPDDYQPNSAAVLSVTLGEEVLTSDAFDTGAWPQDIAASAEPEPTVAPSAQPSEAASSDAAFPYLLLIPLVLVIAALVVYCLLRKKRKTKAVEDDPITFKPAAEESKISKTKPEIGNTEPVETIAADPVSDEASETVDAPAADTVAKTEEDPAPEPVEKKPKEDPKSFLFYFDP